MWIQCFTCKRCQESVQRRGDDPLTYFDYCPGCEGRAAAETASPAVASAEPGEQSPAVRAA